MLHCVTLMDEWMEILWDKPISCDRFLTAKVERVLMGSFLSCSVFFSYFGRTEWDDRTFTYTVNTFPETNSKSPEKNRCLEDNPFLLGPWNAYFQGLCLLVLGRIDFNHILPRKPAKHWVMEVCWTCHFLQAARYLPKALLRLRQYLPQAFGFLFCGL